MEWSDLSFKKLPLSTAEKGLEGASVDVDSWEGSWQRPYET